MKLSMRVEMRVIRGNDMQIRYEVKKISEGQGRGVSSGKERRGESRGGRSWKSEGK